MVTIDSTRNHRTALFIDADSLGNGSEYDERVRRLLQSLNGDNIKTDLFTVASGNGNGGVVRIKTLDVSASAAPASKASDAELTAWAADQGYVQVLFSKPAV